MMENKDKNRAVIYARYSSDKQTEQSIEGQMRVCLKYAEEMKYIVVNSYIDRATTGRNDDRFNFQKMLKDSYEKQFDFVIVYKLDRFARNRYDSAINKALLLKNEVRVLSAMEQIKDTPEGIMLESMLEGMAEYFSAELSQKVKRGIYESVQKGNSTGGRDLFGYKTENKKRVLDPDKAVIVRKIFEMYSSGNTGREIQKELESYTKLSIPGIFYILKNPKYTGSFLYRNVEYKNMYPRIIDDSIFATVTERLQKNKKVPAHNKGNMNYYLSNKLFCECGMPMVGESGKSATGKIYYYYKCKSKHRVSKEWIEQLVLRATVKHLLKKATLEPLVKRIVKAYNDGLKDDTELRLMQKELANTDKELGNLLNALKQGISADFVQPELDRLKAQKKELNAQITKKSLGNIQLDKEMILFWFDQFRNGGEEASKEKIFEIFVAQVKLYPDKAIIVYNHSGKNTTNIDLTSSSFKSLAGLERFELSISESESDALTTWP